MTEQSVKLGTMARVQMRPKLDTEGLLAIARERAPDGTIFDSVEPFFWQVRASSNRLDYYDTRMRAGRGKTLENFARALGQGVSYQDSHNTHKNGWGQSLTGRLVQTTEMDHEINERITEVWGELFTIPGITLGDQSTDSMIAAIRAGVWRDVSVGFYATDIECSICGLQSFQWWKQDGCQHIPGYTYTFQGKEARAFAWINDGELVELSQVYKGASPSAAVQKAEQMSESGKLSDAERAFIEKKHSVRIAEPQKTYALGSIKERTPEPIPTDTHSVITRALERAADVDARLWGFRAGDDLGAAVERLVSTAIDLRTDVRELQATNNRVAMERDAVTMQLEEIGARRNVPFDAERYRG